MKAKMLVCAAGCVLLLFSSGCAKVRYPNYYTLELAPPALQPADGKALQDVAVSVRRFQSPEYLRQGRIVYRETSNRVGFYDYHRWASDPGAAVTTAIIDAIRSARLFSSVRPYDGQDHPTYLVTGRLERLDEIDYAAGGVQVEAMLSADLVDMRTGNVIWTGHAHETSKVEKRDVNSMVMEMSHALQTGVGELVESMEKQLSAPKEEERSTKLDGR